jgi:hypothetical protein
LQNRDTYEDVVVAPSNDQIEIATDTVIFDESDDNHNTSCPITLEPFHSGEEVCSIRFCSHLFKRDALMDWFSRNVRCPVCRYDIRNYVDEEMADPHEFDELIEELIDESTPQPRVAPAPTPMASATRSRPNAITSLLTNTIRSFVTSELNNLPRNLNSAAELLYTFDIPISIDLSGNYRI